MGLPGTRFVGHLPGVVTSHSKLSICHNGLQRNIQPNNSQRLVVRKYRVSRTGSLMKMAPASGVILAVALPNTVVSPAI